MSESTGTRVPRKHGVPPRISGSLMITDSRSMRYLPASSLTRTGRKGFRHTEVCRRFENNAVVLLSQPACQQTRRCQRRSRRVRAVEIGQRAEPAWLSARPSRSSFELEKNPERKYCGMLGDNEGGDIRFCQRLY